MNNELKDIVNGADISTLKYLERNSVDGALKNLLRKRITQLDDKICANCTSKIDPFLESFTLHFGPDDFKKQAHFCALDCMEYFLTSLKEKNEKKMK